MLIVVYRKSAEEAQREIQYCLDKFIYDGHIDDYVRYEKHTIDIRDIRIDFRCGNLNKMASIRPDYYNANDYLASEFLAVAAAKVGGKELNSIREVCEIVFAEIKKGYING